MTDVKEVSCCASGPGERWFDLVHIPVRADMVDHGCLKNSRTCRDLVSNKQSEMTLAPAAATVTDLQMCLITCHTLFNSRERIHCPGNTRRFIEETRSQFTLSRDINRAKCRFLMQLYKRYALLNAPDRD